MPGSFTASKSIVVAADSAKVWDALTTPDIVKQYMFGAEVVSDWKVGSALVYRGQWEGKPYEDKGTILEMEPGKVLKATYYSALGGLPDTPESYNTVTYQLAPEPGGQTKLTVTQTNNPTPESAAAAEENWAMTLKTMKAIVEK